MTREEYIGFILKHGSDFTRKELENMSLATLIILKVQIEIRLLNKQD